MLIKIKEYEFPVPVVALVIILLNFLVQIVATCLIVWPLPAAVRADFDTLDRDKKSEVVVLNRRMNDEYRDGAQREDLIQRYTVEFENLNARYDEKSAPLVAKVPYIRFLRTFGVYPTLYRQARAEISQRMRSGLKHIVWFGLSFFSYQYVHGSWSHFFWNMVFLLIFGLTIENEIGSLWFIAFYHLGGCASGVTHFMFNVASSSPLIGASGAIAAIMGGFLIVAPQARVSLGWIFGPFGFLMGRVSAAMFLFIWIAGNYLSGLASVSNGNAQGVAWFAHVGGFAVGILWFLSREAIDILKPR